MNSSRIAYSLKSKELTPLLPIITTTNTKAEVKPQRPQPALVAARAADASTAISFGAALPTDAAAIWRIAQMVRKDPQQDQRRTGFLVGNFSVADYARLAQSGNLYLLRVGGNAVGFSFIIDHKDATLAKYAYALFHAQLSLTLDALGPFKWIEQTAILPEYRGRGIAASLYFNIYKLFPGFAFVGEIVTQPDANGRSLAFHQKYGGAVIGTFDAKTYAGKINYDQSVILYFGGPTTVK